MKKLIGSTFVALAIAADVHKQHVARLQARREHRPERRRVERRRLARRQPVQPAGDHQVDDEEAPVVERQHHPLAQATEADHAPAPDRGVSMSDANPQVERIRSMFTQGAGLPGREPSGMGIGLYVVQEIVELHEGSVEVESVEVVKDDETNQYVSEVEFLLVEEQPIYETTQVMIRYQNLLGQRYLSLTAADNRGDEMSPDTRFMLVVRDMPVEEGGERVLRLVGAGQTFGEATALLGHAARYDALALADAKGTESRTILTAVGASKDALLEALQSVLTKLSSTFLRPACSKSISSLLPSIAAMVP